MGYEILRVIYLFSPLLGGALFHGLCMRFNWLAILARPLDGGLTVHGQRLFGANKSVRGVIASGVGTALAMALQSQVLHTRLPAGLEYFDYSKVQPLVLGFSLGVAAMLGELLNSFVKRQMHIPPGQSARGIWQAVFYCVDQVDFLLGAWLVLAFVTQVTLERVLLSIVCMLPAHQLVTLLGYCLGLRRTPT